MESDVKYPIYKEGTVVNSKEPSDFHCYICPEKQKDSLEHHLKDENHVQRLECYIKVFANVGPLVYCKLCPKPMNFSEIIEHAVSHKLIPWYVADDRPEILFKNFISQRDHQYFCHLCNVELPFWWMVKHHNKESHHQSLKRDKVNELHLQNLSFSIDYYKLVTNNSIFMKTPKILTCCLCSCDVGTLYDEIITHILELSHQQKEKELIETLESAEIYRVTSEFAHESEKNYLDEVEEESSDTSEDGDIQVICTVCHSLVNSKDIKSHMLIHKEEKRKRKRDNKKSSELNVNVDSLRLKEGLQRIGDDDVAGEIDKNEIMRDNDCITANDNESKFNKVTDILQRVKELSEYSETKENTELNASISKGEIENSRKKLISVDHLIEKPVTLLQDTSNYQELPEGILLRIKDNSFWCTFCNIRLSAYPSVLEHSKGKRHIEKQRKIYFSAVDDPHPKNGIIHYSTHLYECSLCKCKINGMISVKQHLSGSRHREMLKLQNSKSNSIHSNPQNSGNNSIANDDEATENLKTEINIKPTAPTASIAEGKQFNPDTRNYQELPTGILPSQRLNFFWCRICQVEMSGYCNALGHSKGRKHLEQRDSPLSTMDNNLSEKGIINISYNVYECFLCKCRITGWISVEQHIKGSRHRATVKLQEETNGECSSINSNTRNSSVSQYSSSSSLSTLSNRLETLVESLPMGITHLHDKTYKCSFCKIGGFTSIRTHVKTLIHKQASEKEHNHVNTNGMSSRSSFSEVNPNSDGSKGTSVDQSVDSPLPSTEKSKLPEEVINNVISKEKQNDSLPKGIINIYANYYTCIICNSDIPSLNLIEKHVEGVWHRHNIQQLGRKESISVNSSSVFSTPALRTSGGSGSIPDTNKKTLDEQQSLPRSQTTVLLDKGTLQVEPLPQEIIHTDGTTYFCKVCKCKMYTVETIKSHLGGKRHRQALEQLENPSSSCADQDLPKGILHVYDKVYCCIACQCGLGPSKSFEIHVKDPQHEENVKMLGKRMPDGAILGRRITCGLANGIIHLYGNQYACLICKCETSVLCVKGHLEGSRHKYSSMTSVPTSLVKSTVNAGDNERKFSEKTITSKLSPAPSQSSLNSQGSRRKSDKKFEGISEIAGTDSISCEVCHNGIFNVKNGIYGHINGKTHQMHLEKKLGNLPEGIISTEIDNLFWCRTCDETLEGFNNVNLHSRCKQHKNHQPDSLIAEEDYGNESQKCNLLNEKQEKSGGTSKIGGKQIDALPKGIIYVHGHLYRCSLCDCPITGVKSIPKHIKGQQHKEALVQFPKEKKTSVSSNGTNSRQSVYYSFSTTPVSSEKSVSPEKIINMREETPEKEEVYDFPEGIIHVDGNLFECSLCKLKFSGLKSLEDHVKDLYHQNKISGVTDEQVNSKNSCSGPNSCSLSTKSELSEPIKHLPRGIIHVLGEKYECSLCKQEITGLESVEKHVEGLYHQGKGFPLVEEQLNSIDSNVVNPEKTVLSSSKSSITSTENQKPAKMNEQSNQSPWNQENLPEGIERVFTITNNSLLICTICICKLSPWISVEEHVASSDHLANGKKEVVRISKYVFKCEHCDCNLTYSKLLKHLKDDNHHENRSLKMSGGSEKLSELPEGMVRQENGTTFLCKICTGNPTGNLADAYNHFYRKKHQDKVEELNKKKESYERNPSVQFSTNEFKLKSEGFDDSASSSACKAPGAVENNSLDALASGAINVMDENIVLPSLSENHVPEGFEAISHEKFLLCTICYCIVRPEDVEEHVSSSNHMENWPRVISRIAEFKFKCDICNCNMQGYKKTRQHLKSDDHRMKKALKLADSLGGLKELQSEAKDDSTSSLSSSALETVEKTLIKMEDDSKIQVMGKEFFWKSSNKEENETDESSQINNLETPWNSENLPEGIERVFTRSKNLLLICTICNCKLPLQISVEDHVASIDHRDNGKKVIVRIKQNEFKCEICDCTLGRYTKVMKHLKGEIHCQNKSRNSPTLDKSCALPEGILRQENDPRFWCRVCLVNITGTLACANLHVSSMQHQIRQQQFKTQNINFVNCNFRELFSAAHQPLERFQKKPEELLPKKQNPSIESVPKSLPQDLPAGIERIEDQNFFFCTICNMIFFTTVNQHFSATDHHTNGPKVISRLSDHQYHCDVCNCTIDSYLAVMRHLREEIHEKNKKLKMSNNSTAPEKIYQLPEKLIKLGNDDMFWCTLCFVEGLLEHADVHAARKKHKIKLEKSKAEEIAKNPTKIPVKSPEVPERNTTAPRFISTFNLENREDSMSSSAPVEPEEYRKILPQSIRKVPCQICNCMISGGNVNVNEHRNSKEHMENLAKVNSPWKSPEKKENKVFSAPSTPQELYYNDIPPEKMLEYHYIGNIIDCIECKVCDLKIRETRHTPANLEYLSHTMSQQHKDNEIMFINSWKSSMTSSYAAKASQPAIQQTPQKNRQFVNKTGEKKIPCLICGDKFEFQNDLHSHMTKHLWKRFLKVPIAEESEERVFEENDENEESCKIPETQQMESPEDEGDLEFNEENLNDSPKREHSPRQYRKTPLDIELDNEINIYEIDEQRRKDLQLGVLLSFTIDKDNIYCLVCRKSVRNSVKNSYEHLSSVDHLNYLQEMIEDHKKFQNHPDQLSDLALAHEYMQEVSDHDVQCHACGLSVPNDSLKLNHHINDPSHAEKWSSLGLNAKEIFNGIQSRMEFDFYSTRKYWCVPCSKKWTVEIEFREHLNKKKHAKKIRQFESEMVFDYCAVCATLWYGFLKTFSYHSTCKMHKAQASQNYYLVTKLPQSAQRLLYAAEDQIEKIIKKVDTRRIDNRKKEDQLIRDLERISKEKYPSVKTYPFGSRVSGIGGKSSDLDIFLDCSTKKCRVYSGENSSYQQVLVRLDKIENCLEKDVQNWYIDRSITNCRIPIIKATHRPTGIECDLSFTNGLTVENTKMINAYCENYPECRKLIIFVKNWMGHCDLTGLNGVNSYGIAWLVIYFLQVSSILPTVHELIDKKKESKMIGGWETGVEIDFEACSTEQSFRELLTKFFKFYATFDYRNNVICPLLGESVKKIDFQRPRNLPSEMKHYLNYLNEMDKPEPFRIDCVMCLQDPFDLSHNISKAVKKFVVYRLKTFCSFSAQILDNNA